MTWAEAVALLGPADRGSPGLQPEFELVLRVTAEGACEVRLDHDPACAEDGGFFRS